MKLKTNRLHKCLCALGAFAVAAPLLMSSPAIAQQRRGGFSRGNANTMRAEQSTLTVTGEAEVQAAPDRAQINLGAEAQENDAAAATARVNSIMNGALKNIKKLGIKDDAIQTTQVSLYPVYQNLKSGESGPAKVIAYRAGNSVRITVDDLSLIGKVLDAGSKAGINRQNGVNFELKDDGAARSDALKIAAKEAQRKAESLAESLDLQLGNIRTVDEGNTNVVLPRAYTPNMAVASTADSTPVSPGQITVRANVSITYTLRPANARSFRTNRGR